MGEITIEVDGLPVEVDAEDWGADPHGVEEQVRQARRETSMGPIVEGEEEPDYNTLYGDDSNG